MSRTTDGERHVPILNAANMLTVVRIIVVPIFAAMVVVSGMERTGWRVAACAMFCLASATDYVDGWIARNWDMVTSFGKVADPIADKALIGTGLVLLSMYGSVPVWVTSVILLREVGVTGLRFWVIRRAVIAASRGGKIKTALQILAVAWCLAPLPATAQLVGWWIMMVAMVATVVTGLDYVALALRVRRMPVPVPAAVPVPVSVPLPASVPIPASLVISDGQEATQRVAEPVAMTREEAM